MAEQPTTIHVVPTELERADAFYDLAGCAAACLISWYAILYYGVPWQWFVLPLAVVAIWALTGEPAGDVPYVGALAAGIRSKLGLRRGHEWVLAYVHYLNLAITPVWRARCHRSYLSFRRQTTLWRTQPSAQIRWCRSRASSRVSAIPHRFSRRRAK